MLNLHKYIQCALIVTYQGIAFVGSRGAYSGQAGGPMGGRGGAEGRPRGGRGQAEGKPRRGRGVDRWADRLVCRYPKLR